MAIDQTRISGICAAFKEGALEKDVFKAADLYWAAWTDLWKILGEEGIRSAKVAENKIDWQFGNWANDTDDALNIAKRYEDEIELSRNILEMEWDDALFHENARRSIADCYASMGEMAKARDLYEKYLGDDSRWGWGWIGYLRLLRDSGDTRFLCELDAMYERLAADPELRDEEDVCEELGNLYADHGEMEKADRCHKAVKALADAKPLFPTYAASEKQQMPMAGMKLGGSVASKAVKVGRNEPCPCGSGKKYKKCCGRNPS